MASGIGKNDTPAEHDSGVGRIRERTVSIGDTLIAIDNIGSIQILDVRRNWALARLGAFVVAGGAAVMMMPSNPYSYGGSGGSPGQMIGLALVGVGLAMIIGNWLQPLRKGLGIGTSDGRISYVVSEDHAFLHRLLEFLTQKINTRNEGLTASFDITHNTFNTNGGGIALGAGATASGVDSTIANTNGGGLVIGAGGVASGAGGHAAGAEGAISVTNNVPPPPPVIVAAPPPPLPLPPPPTSTTVAPIDTDEALFADEPQSIVPPVALKPRVDPPKPVAAVAAARTRPRDPLLDGPETPARDEDSRDWLSAPGRIGYNSAPEGGGARWLLPLVLLLVVGGGSFAGWYFYSQSEAAKSSSLMPAAGEPPPAAAESASAAPSEAAPTPIQDASALPAEAPAGPAPTELSALDNSTPAPEATSFTPSEVIVARASGLRYRARPSSADDVPILAETRAGGEGLLVTGITTQPDGDWYQVTLEDGRSAWFKASLTVQRSRFAETFATNVSAPSLSFAAASPRVLEPAEGVQLPGGAQPVRLAWQGPANASGFIVEIEAYDATARRWIENPVHKRVSVESAEELAELIPRTGAWRWRVRGVSAGGEQSQFSRWAAFGLRN